MRRNPEAGRLSWLAILLSCALVAGACGGDDDDSGGAAPDETEEDAGGEDTGGDEPAGETGSGGDIIFGADQDFSGYNSATSKDNSLAAGQIMRNVWASAYRTRPDFTLEPYLIKEEATVVSEKPFTVEWKIRDEAEWSDGTPVTSDDLAYAAEMCNKKNEKADCASTSGFDLITELTKPDPKTLRAVFSQPYADYKGLMFATPYHIAKERAPGGDMVEAWNTAFDQDPGVACGPFKVGKRVKGSSLTLERNDSFWGDPAVLDRIIFRFLPESGSQVDALRNEEVKLIYPQPQLDQVKQVGELSGVTSGISFGPTFEHLTFNFKNPFLAIPEVRQAIALGLDRVAIVDKLMKPFSDKASQLDNRVLVSTQKGYEPHGAKFAKADVAGAQTLLKKAGFVKDGEFFAKDGEVLALRLSTTAGNQLREQQGQLIQLQLKEVGIRINIANFPADVFFGERLPGGDFDIGNFAWVGTALPASGAKQIYDSESDSNFGKYSNPKVDKMLQDALGEVDETARLKLLNQIDAALWDDLVNLPLYQKPTFLAHYDDYVNIEDNTTTESPFWNSEAWALLKSAK